MPYRVEADLLACVHQHLVDENEGRKILLMGNREQRGHEIFGGCGVTFLLSFVWVEKPQTIRSGDLESDYAPRVFKPALFALGTEHLHSLLGVELVERQHRDASLGKAYADVLLEFIYCGKVG